jgi:hypothetical protein
MLGGMARAGEQIRIAKKRRKKVLQQDSCHVAILIKYKNLLSI